MIKYIVLVLILLSVSCNSTKKQVKAVRIEESVEIFCPKDGDCSVSLIKNKSLSRRNDITGSIYYELTNNLKTDVIKFEYNKKVDTTLQDSHYREELLFEIPSDFDEIKLEDKELESVKMLFGKHCFCKGKAGIYLVKKGKIIIKKDEQKIFFNLEFEVENTDQKIKKITNSIKI